MALRWSHVEAYNSRRREIVFVTYRQHDAGAPGSVLFI
jgi:hypothetical protein